MFCALGNHVKSTERTSSEPTLGLVWRVWGFRELCQGVGSLPKPTPQSSLTIGDQTPREALAGQLHWNLEVRPGCLVQPHALQVLSRLSMPLQKAPHQSWTRRDRPGPITRAPPSDGQTQAPLPGQLSSRWGACPTSSECAQPCCPLNRSLPRHWLEELQAL